MTEIHNYLQITEEDLPCLCKASNVSENYLREFGEVHLVVDIITEPYFTDTYPHTQSYGEIAEKYKHLYIKRAVTDNNRLYDYAIKE